MLENKTDSGIRLIGIRTLLFWQIAGVLTTTVFIVLISVTGLAWVSHGDTSFASVQDNVLQTLLFLIFGAPFALAFLFLWTKLARSAPWIEKHSGARFGILTFSAAALAALLISGCMLVSAMLSGDIRSVWTRLSIDGGEFAFLCLAFGFWASGPRVLIPSLRVPLAFR